MVKQTFIMLCHSVIEVNGLVFFLKPLVKPVTKGHMYVHLYEMCQNRQTIETESRLAVVRGWEKKE